jgi:hypothetical protein
MTVAQEAKNQQGAFLTMYNFGRKQGLTDAQAADYGTDVPILAVT